MDTEYLYQIYKKHPNICTDSRKAIKNSIFFALKGEKFDGNQFYKDALNNNCDFVVVDNPKIEASEKVIKVKNALESLQELALFHRKKNDIPYIAITGTNGKTTTKELIRSVLNTKYKVLATEGNLNNHIGVPLTLLKIKNNTETAIIEMGANHPNEISELCKIALPTHGIITNIGKAHLEGFKSFSGVIRAKNELYQFLIRNNGVIFNNGENELLNKLLNNYKSIKYFPSEYQISTYREIFVSLNYKNKAIHTKLVGSYNLENIVAAIIIGEYFDIEKQAIIESIENYKPNNIRSQFVTTEKNKIIVDTYNANPSSMQLAIENFSKLNVKNKLLILGDMYELGRDSTKEHKRILDLLTNYNFKDVILIGHNFTEVNNNLFTSYTTTKKFLTDLKGNPASNRSILIKGSRAMKLEQLIEYL